MHVRSNYFAAACSLLLSTCAASILDATRGHPGYLNLTFPVWALVRYRSPGFNMFFNHLTMGAPHANIIERIERHLPRMADGECWIPDNVSQRGRHQIRQNGVTLTTARVAWEAHNAEPIPPGMVVCHTCDNPACINPEHLFIDTQQGNLADMRRKHRDHRQYFHLSLILKARKLYESGLSVKTIALYLGIPQRSLYAYMPKRS